VEQVALKPARLAQEEARTTISALQQQRQRQTAAAKHVTPYI
jgi:hypothetical protein